MTNRLVAPKMFPTCLTAEVVKRDSLEGASGYHESLMRSYQVLQLVKELLEKRVDHEVIQQIISLNYED